MLHSNTLSEISNNINTGVEYEIALFFKLIENNPNERTQVMNAICKRSDATKIQTIIADTDVSKIESTLRSQGYNLLDSSFETQNDTVGPADIVMYVADSQGRNKQIGLSVKYANTCTLNVTGKNFITDTQITQLKAQLPTYTKQYIEEMTSIYGSVENWFRKRKPSKTTDQYIDLIRDAVIANWGNVANKTILLSALFHSDSPIDYWVVTYGNRGYKLKTTPKTIDIKRANNVTVRKYQTSFVAFYLDGTKVGHMQVKFNNGFVEKCKKARPDVIWQGVRMSYGQPFSSWNFSVEE